ncbi:MAG TPA: ester cyclase [Sphingobacteriaceae bacterium]
MKLKIALLLFMVAGAFSGQAQQTPDQSAKNKIAAAKIIKAFDAGDTQAFDNLIAKDVVSHSEMPPGIKSTGLEAVKEMCKMNKKAFPDMKSVVHTIATAGATVMVFYTSEGTNSGEFYGMPATNKTIKTDGVDIMRFQNGKAVEHWGVYDSMKMMQQLGLLPPPPPPTENKKNN